MPLKGNNVVANVHCKKDWMNRVRCHLNQAGKKKARRMKRMAVRGSPFCPFCSGSLP
jgi:large subunit ribosomal protein L13e